MDTIESLEQIGLDEKEARIYLATLELGEAPASIISKKSGIQRTYCYDLLNSLAEKGFISYIEKNDRRLYSAVKPKIVQKIVSDKMRSFGEIIPDLESLYQNAPQRPRVRFFEGKEGVDLIHQEILDEAKEVWFVGSIADWAKQSPNYIEIVKDQVRHGIKIRDLVKAEDVEFALKYSHFYKKGFHEMRIMPKTSPFRTDNMIWANKFVMISYGMETYAVSVESAEIAQTMRVVYELLWTQAKKIQP